MTGYMLLEYNVHVNVCECIVSDSFDQESDYTRS